MARKIIEAETEITKFKFPNIGVGEYGGIAVNIKNTLPGQKVKARIVKKRRSYIGQAIEKTQAADYEIEPLCPDFLNCGSCTFQNRSYDKELDIKKNMVSDILNGAGFNLGFDIAPSIVPSPKISGYRNKMEFSFGDNGIGSDLELGMRKMGSFYEVVTSRHCNIIDKDFREILLGTLNFFRANNEPFYHKKLHTGSLRHLVIRKGSFTNEIFVNLVTASGFGADIGAYVNLIKSLNIEGEMVGISHTINNSLSDVVKADGFNLLYGRSYFYERINNLIFKISPFSFFQTNSAGAEVLYNTVVEFAGGISGKVVFDLYCGTGVIAQIVARHAKKVYGVEIIEEAVDAAIENASLNNLNNCEFITGDVLRVVDGLNIKPDIIVLDPPRDGVHPKALEKIISFGAETIIYVSCKPTSLARDLQILIGSGYNLQKIKCHDMFPRTYHVETVCLLSAARDGCEI
ncbi:MAG: 23S rRNA (uracil(1939)-C(5))-methyltransferase RlmD [Clostridiales bacterium]|jgi:23S rRNA (uracil-5-)-methyltransferase RumA|nr:23S rRNA (uracil(1939)-C(5))-methyltransferase RlmD [Clostridiales bacterium]